LFYSVTDRNITFSVPLSHVTCWALEPICKSSSLPVDRKYQKGKSRDNYIISFFCTSCRCIGCEIIILWTTLSPFISIRHKIIFWLVFFYILVSGEVQISLRFVDQRKKEHTSQASLETQLAACKARIIFLKCSYFVHECRFEYIEPVGEWLVFLSFVFSYTDGRIWMMTRSAPQILHRQANCVHPLTIDGDKPKQKRQRKKEHTAQASLFINWIGSSMQNKIKLIWSILNFSLK
jgi:hypothetical protein